MLKFFDATQNPMVELCAARYVDGKGWVLDASLPKYVHHVFTGDVRIASDGSPLSATSSKTMVEEEMPDVFGGNLLCGVYPDDDVTPVKADGQSCHGKRFSKLSGTGNGTKIKHDGKKERQ